MLTTALRDIVTGIMNMDEGNRFFGEMMSGITTRYALGKEHPLVGKLCANLALTINGEERKLFALMQDGNGLLVDATETGAATKIAGMWSPRVRCVQVQSGTSMLLRPDACIAWASDGEDTEDLEFLLGQWFGMREVSV